MMKAIIMILLLSIFFQSNSESKPQINYIDSMKSYNSRINILEEKAKENNEKFSNMLNISRDSIDMLKCQYDRLINLFFVINGILGLLSLLLGFLFKGTYDKYNKIKDEIDEGLKLIKNHSEDLTKQKAVYDEMATSYGAIMKKYEGIDEKIEKFESEVRNSLRISSINSSIQYSIIDNKVIKTPPNPNEKET